MFQRYILPPLPRQCLGKIKNACKNLVRKSEGNRRLGRLNYRYENNIKIDFNETGYKGVD
jgi:hypothetical protein